MKYLLLDISRTDALTLNFSLKYYKHYLMQVAWCSLVLSKDLGITLYRKHENSKKKKYYILDTFSLALHRGKKEKNIELNNLFQKTQGKERGRRRRKRREGEREKREMEERKKISSGLCPLQGNFSNTKVFKNQ